MHVTIEVHTHQQSVWQSVENRHKNGEAPWSHCNVLRFFELYAYPFPFDHALMFLVLLCRFHIPRSWLKPFGNRLTLFEEVGGDPTKVSFGTRAIREVCSLISGEQPSLDVNSTSPTMTLHCGQQQTIASIHLANYGNPQGSCVYNTLKEGSCNSPKFIDIVKEVLKNSLLLHNNNLLLLTSINNDIMFNDAGLRWETRMLPRLLHNTKPIRRSMSRSVQKHSRPRNVFKWIEKPSNLLLLLY